MSKTMDAIADATARAIATRGEGKPFHRTIPSHGYEVERDVPAAGYRYPSEDGTVTVYYHGTAVARIAPDGRVRLDSNRYHTVTTKAVMNAALAGAGLKLKVSQVKGDWRVWTWLGSDQVEHRFEDGMTVKAIASASGEVYDFDFGYPEKPGRCRYDFGIVGVYHGRARDDLGGMCESCMAS